MFLVIKLSAKHDAYHFLFEEFWQHVVQILAPICPNVTFVGFKIFIFAAVLVEHFAEIHIVLIEKIRFTDGNQIQFWLLFEKLNHLFFQILISILLVK